MLKKISKLIKIAAFIFFSSMTRHIIFTKRIPQMLIVRLLLLMIPKSKYSAFLPLFPPVLLLLLQWTVMTLCLKT